MTADVDESLHGGYNARWGPFEQIDQLGVDWFVERITADGLEVPPVLQLAAGRSFYKEEGGKRYRLMFDFAAGTAEYAEIVPPEGVLSLARVKGNSKPLVTHHSGSLWDIGDGVTCLEPEGAFYAYPNLTGLLDRPIRGRQPVTLEGADVWLMPSTSGRAIAHRAHTHRGFH